jgi:dGTPase
MFVAPINTDLLLSEAEKENLYDRLLHICHYVSMLTDGNALELFETINGTKKS